MSLDEKSDHLQVAIPGSIMKGSVAIVISLHGVTVQIQCEMLDNGKVALCCSKMERSVSISICNSWLTAILYN